MHQLSIKDISEQLHAKKLSSVELTQHFLARIKQYDSELNSFITVCEDEALAQAKAADSRLQAGDAGPLTGIPVAHKDIFCTLGVKTTCASKMLDNFISPYDATVVHQGKTAGLVMLGKTNLDEFAMGSSNENSHYGPVHNPWATDCVPGGSSGGSAAAVAARLTPLATGTDTGGSIRQPAALCGLTGLKPTYGRVSRYGMIAYASSLDQGGPMAASAEDVAYLLQAMAGFDEKDSTSLDEPVPDYLAGLNQDIAGKKIGLPAEYFNEGLDPAVKQAVMEAAKQFESMGATLVDIKLPSSQLAVPAYYVIAPAECSSNLARFDGVRYGYRAEAPQNLEELYKQSRGEGFGAEVKRRIMVGTYTLSAGYYDAYYIKAQKIRRLIADEFKQALSEVDFILSPTSPTPTFALGSKTADPIQMYLSDIYTIAVNLAGLPAISFNCGFTDNKPVGCQLIGNYFAEDALLNMTHRFQQATQWHQSVPAKFEN
jgi:aspartyl-tRNA(Asn)/glutamyl-tRNA(Gln) amidotransferase subunit A